ncbi:proline iminopeptidase [Cryobacterium roopkundense]|uniref:Proline iminopeptidase n=1 Tax=Cryobacterium roopkundense TaxID=1001240 RepID=A0A099J345_9MICO|nr:prolyl aminopeptidase [Cryobacterium roopkundense]KGJ72470.1 proline iminopeptidase [Cryobacterium roopkundense]MBB5642822.1 proline iminopeptidase [Cryobacterium roopkundense]
MESYPPIEPFATGMMDVGDGHGVYWETSGNPSGTPVVMLHGGPGSGSTPGGRRNWNPSKYLIVQLDQRNCGKSTPSASDPAVTLETNTLHHLIDDLEQLRAHLRVDRWVVWGASWGCTLALAYAEAHPDRVRALILVSVTMTRPSDVHWLYHDIARYLPEQWRAFQAGVPVAERDGDLVAAYDRLLNQSGDSRIQADAAQRWCDWEDAAVSLEPGWSPSIRYQDADFRMQFARIVAHYFSHGAWLQESQVLRDAHRLQGIPGVLIHGALDIGGPVDVPWQLAQAWPDAQLTVVGQAGHHGSARTLQLILEASARFETSP